MQSNNNEKPIALANGVGVVPSDIPPNPHSIPEGHTRWVVRGWGWLCDEDKRCATYRRSRGNWELWPYDSQPIGDKEVFYIEAMKEPLPAAPVSETLTCDLPPAGWYCTREAGHEGPCAAIERGSKHPSQIDLKKLYESMPRDLQRKVSCHDLKRTVDAYNEEEPAPANGIGGEESLVGKHGEFTAKRVTYQCVVTEEIDKDFMPRDVVVTYIRDGEKIEGARIPRSEFRPNPTSDPCESESPKPDEGEETPLTDNYFSTKTNLTDAKSFCYHLELRLASSESDLAAARAERNRAVAYSNSVERGEIKFTSLAQKELEKILTLGLPKDINEGLGDAVVAEIQRLRAALEDMGKKSTWNRDIRDSLVKLFKDDGWQDDCTLINELTNMNFDALAPASPNSTPAPDGWRSIRDNPPKDGTWFLVFDLDNGTPADFYVMTWEKTRNTFIDNCGDAMSFTHWMPLPTAPASSGKGASDV